MNRYTPLVLATLLAACSGGERAEDKRLEEAAEQSTPEAAAVLENAAENGMNAQDALEAAGNAQAGNTAEPAANAQ